MDSFRLRALWIMDADTGTICAERRYNALERSHRHGASMMGIPSTDIVTAVLDTIAAKTQALEGCGGVHSGSQLTSHFLLGPYASPQLVDTVSVSTAATGAGSRGMRGGGRLAGKHGMGSAAANEAVSTLAGAVANLNNAIQGGDTTACAAQLPSSDNDDDTDSNAANDNQNQRLLQAADASNNTNNASGNNIPTALVGPFVAFSAHRGVRIEVAEPLIKQIAEGTDDYGMDDGGVTQRAIIDQLLTTFETHPQYGAVENLIVIAAPLVAKPIGGASTQRVGAASATSAAPLLPTGSLPFRHLLVHATTALQTLLKPFIDDTLVVGIEGAVMTSELELGMSVITDLMGGWDQLCARRVVSDLTWRRALESLLSVGISMGRMVSVVAEGPARHGLPNYLSLLSSSSNGRSGVRDGNKSAEQKAASSGTNSYLHRRPPFGSKVLHPHTLLRTFDLNADDDDGLGGSTNSVGNSGGDDEIWDDMPASLMSYYSSTAGGGHALLASATGGSLETALSDAAKYQTTLFVEQHVAAQCFGNAANATLTVQSHVMMAPPLKQHSRFTNCVTNTDSVFCLLGGVPPPHASYWSTALSRTGPAASVATPNSGGGPSSSINTTVATDAFLKTDSALIASVVGAPDPIPMAIPMCPSLVLDKRRLAEEGLGAAGTTNAMGLGRFVASGQWRLPALNPSLPTTAATQHLANRFVNVSNSEAYPPITAVTLVDDFAHITRNRRDADGASQASAGTLQTGGGASSSSGSSALLTTGYSETNRNGVRSAATAARLAATANTSFQKATPILTTTHEVPKVLNSNHVNANASVAGVTANTTTAIRANGITGTYALVPIIDYDRARRAITTMDYGQGVGIDATVQEVHSRTKEDLLNSREWVENLLDMHGHVLYRLDMEITVDVGGIATADIPKLDVVFGLTDHVNLLYYHLNITREEGEVNPSTGATGGSGIKQAYSNVTSMQLNPMEFMLSFVHGAGARVKNGTSYSVKGIVVCDVTERPTSASLPSFSVTAAKPSVAPSEADILAAITVYSSATLHFTMLVERPFLPGSFIIADPMVVGKCLVDGSGGGGGGGGSNPTSSANFATANKSQGAFTTDAGNNNSTAAMSIESIFDALQKRIRAVAFSSKGTGTLVERQLRSAVRIGLPTSPLPSDGDSPLTWRRSDLTHPAPITAAVIVRSHPEKGFALWNYSGDV